MKLHRTMNKKHALFTLAILSVAAPHTRGSVIIQELFDGITGADASINGKGNGSTSVGMTGNWATNGSTGIFTASNFNVDGSTLPGLASNAGSQGGVWNNTGNSFSTSIYATRALGTAISFSTTQDIFFSVRLRNHGDTAMGIGLTSAASGGEMIGAGFHWNNTPGNVANNAAYITHGTLGVGSGSYGIQASDAPGSVDGYGLLVGRISINALGNDVISIKRYAQNATIDNDLTAIAWGATSSVNSSMTASHLLLWVNGSGGGELDAIRLGTTWTDVTGVTVVPEASSALLGGLGLLALLRRRR